MPTWSFRKKPKIYNGKKKASSINGTGLTDSLYVENENRSLFVALHKAQVKVDQGPQHKARYTGSNKKESVKDPWTYWHRRVGIF